MPEIRCIIYISSATQDLSEQGLNNLLTKSRARNAKMGVTGILLNKDRSFMQYIEGSIDGLEKIYAIIKKDHLHTGMIEMFNEPILIRQFPEWSMAYHQGQFSTFSRPEDYSEHLALKSNPADSNEASASLLLNQFWNS